MPPKTEQIVVDLLTGVSFTRQYDNKQTTYATTEEARPVAITKRLAPLVYVSVTLNITAQVTLDQGVVAKENHQYTRAKEADAIPKVKTYIP